MPMKKLKLAIKKKQNVVEIARMNKDVKEKYMWCWWRVVALYKFDSS